MAFFADLSGSRPSEKAALTQEFLWPLGSLILAVLHFFSYAKAALVQRMMGTTEAQVGTMNTAEVQ